MAHEGICQAIELCTTSYSFPVSPPFFRIIHPRFLPFIHGGGGERRTHGRPEFLT